MERMDKAHYSSEVINDLWYECIHRGVNKSTLREHFPFSSVAIVFEYLDERNFFRVLTKGS